MNEVSSEIAKVFLDMLNYLRSHPWLVAGLLVFVLGSRPLGEDPFKDIRRKLAVPPLQALQEVFNRLGLILKSASDSTDNTLALPDSVGPILGRINRNVKEATQRRINSITSHISKVLKVLSPDESLRVWRIAGAIITAILLVLFIYADLVQGINNLSLVASSEFGTPRWLSNLQVAILVSSIGTTFTLALLIIDWAGVTHFVPWGRSVLTPTSEPPKHSRIWLMIALPALLLNILLVAVIALYRATLLLETTGFALSPEFKNYLAMAYAFAQSLTIVPMLITTILLFWGIMGIIVTYVLFVGVIVAVLQGINGILFLFEQLFSVLQPASALATRFFLTGFGFVFTLVALVLGTILSISNHLSRVVELAVESLINLFSIFLFIPIKFIRFLASRIM